ncbi:serine hydrolase domain-containing protein [Poritiphilus flavus]|uniref:Serine hydrolase n=1 Tax=Poritiphilus flavus TaxID=2697053 RepID=A0A6L9EH02_9FLAO|nr:serine hydrolase domain-containing protein [Poritiphilus flavus]NAS13985.1 serine hydrolase [Poritiphilus flavus]
MKKTLLLLVLIAISSLSFGQITESQAIDSIFSQWDSPEVPGCSLGIIKEGSLIYSKGYGLANMEYGIPNSGKTVFRIGSTSKQFTAACIVLLAEQGKLSLEDNLKDLYPDFPDYASKITIRHLLNHTSGIRDYLALSYLKGLRGDDYYEDAEIMQWLINQTDLNFDPGEEYLYSNSGYWLLGQIVEKVSGKNMADFAREQIFEPLNMNSTHFHNDHKQIVRNRAFGYAPTGEGSYRISMTTLNMIGDGGIFTSIQDIKKWDDAYYNSTVLSKEFWDMMTQQGVLNDGEVISYASGLDIEEYKGLKTIRHGGAFVGFRAELLRFPDQRLSIAIFANRADASPWEMANQVADVMLKDSFMKAATNASESKKSNNKDTFIKLSLEKLGKYTGDYWNESDAYTRRIYVKNDTLRYYRNANSESALMPLSEKEFKMINVSADVIIRFDDKEKRTMQVTVNDGDPSNFNAYQPVNYTNEALSGYEGRYFSKELDIFYSLELENDSLILYINDNKKSLLKPIVANLFTNDDYGTFQFTSAPDGKPAGFTLAAGRVKNLKFEKK